MTFTPETIAAAQAAAKATGIPASVTLAQSLQESGGGRFIPPGSNNWLGIQALPGLPSVAVQSFEYRGGRRIDVVERFAVFASVADCFWHHGELISTNRAYRYAMARLPGVGVKPTPLQVKAFVESMGPVYATDPHYAADVISLMDEDNLYQYDV